ncbi:hypothetical protein JHK85_025129 [Glycine max]|nr:hypothetical protein JHK85_025129 [Glycine max]KAG5012367.1 hypothetical protein JHK86_024628 [Glycine max]
MQFLQMKFHEVFSNLGRHVHSLAHAASGYHKVLEENHKLYNQVQDLKGLGLRKLSCGRYCQVLREAANGGWEAERVKLKLEIKVLFPFAFLKHIDFNVVHCAACNCKSRIYKDENDFRSRGRLPCGRDSHLRGRLLEYKCEVKSHIVWEWEG